MCTLNAKLSAFKSVLRTGARLLIPVAALLASELALAATAKLDVKIAYISRDEQPFVPLSLLDMPIKDNGLLGARLGLNDNQTTGTFIGHTYDLKAVVAGQDASISDSMRPEYEAGVRFFIADLEANDLVELADAYPDALLVNVRAEDNRLRMEDCRANVFHIAPSRAMLADGLMQYFGWKRWDELVLVTGRHDEDALFAASMTRAAKRFGLKIVDSKQWTSIPGARRADSGHHGPQQEIPVFSRFKEHDVVLVADEFDEFGEYFSYRTSEPRPVAGTQGLIPSAWHRTQEQWGATQIQRRFIKLADRIMSARDYGAWAGMRSLGEAITQMSSMEVEVVRAFLLSDRFKLAAFKGVPLTFRPWNGQLRQPVLVVGARMLVSVSPQKGFLHQVTELDTLGFDQPESTCQAFTKNN